MPSFLLASIRFLNSFSSWLRNSCSGDQLVSEERHSNSQALKGIGRSSS
jgi:hypothetical protein